MLPGKKAVLLAIVALTLIGAIGAFWFSSSHQEQLQAASIGRKQSINPVSPHTTGDQREPLLLTAKQETLSDSEAGQEASGALADEVAINTGSDSETDNPYIDREVKARLAQVADAYASQIRYPSFSVPIPNPEALQKYLPNRSFAAELPLDIEDEMSPRIHLQTDKQQYVNGDTINVTVSLSGLTGDHRLAVQVRLLGEGQTLVTADAVADGQQVATFRLRLAGPERAPVRGTVEYRVVARIDIDGKAYEIGTPVSYVSSVCEVTHVGMSRVSGEYLHIPVDVTTTKPGYHELIANLYGGNSGRALVHLSAQTELQSTNALMQLKVHVDSLKVSGDPGPYLLKDVVLTRMPSAPEFTTEYGTASQEAYLVNGYAFDEYDDVPYVDEEAAKRLEFLQQLSRIK